MSFTREDLQTAFDLGYKEASLQKSARARWLNELKPLLPDADFSKETFLSRGNWPVAGDIRDSSVLNHLGRNLPPGGADRYISIANLERAKALGENRVPHDEVFKHITGLYHRPVEDAKSRILLGKRWMQTNKPSGYTKSNI